MDTSKHRYLTQSVISDALLDRKIAIVSGPRQVGKSTLAQTIVPDPHNYFLYDKDEFRRAWARSPTQAIAGRAPGPFVLDEIHKDGRWKTKLKGIYDSTTPRPQIIVTGSARLDHFKRGGDSLLGRYVAYRLHPFSVGEGTAIPAPDELNFENRKPNYPWSDLMQLGGFPEPLFKGRREWAERWSRTRLDRIVLDDSRDISTITDLNAFKTLALLLADGVGSPLSVNALREDVGKAHATLTNWISILEALYVCFLIRPWSARIRKALRLEPKLYLFDVLSVPKDAVSKRLENLAALHLKKACDAWTDTAQGNFELRYLRDKNKREVDFAIIRDSKPWMLVECKSNEIEPSADLIYYSNILKPVYTIQLTTQANYQRRYQTTGVHVIDYESFFAAFP